MRISRREFVTSVTASGIALTMSRLAIAEEPRFAARETLPGRQSWNPAANGARSHRRRPQGHGSQALRVRFSRCRSPGLAAATSYAMLILAPDATHVYTGMDLSRLSGALKPAVVVTAADLARIGTRVPEFYAGDLFCPVGTTPLYLGQPVALLIFEQFDAFDQARLALRDGTFVKFGEETGPIRAPDYGAYRFTRVAGPTPDAPDVYSTFKDGLFSPGQVQNTELPVWTPLAMPKAQPYAKAATYGEQIRAELAASNPALLVLDREFETQSNDPVFLEPECGIAWYDAGRKNLELVLGVQSPFENAEAIVFLLGETAPPSSRRASTLNSPMSAADSADATIPRSRCTLRWRGCSSRIVRSGSPTTAISSSRRASSGTHSKYTRGSGSIARAARLSRFAADHILDGGGLANFSGTVAKVGAQMAIGVYDIPRVDVTTVALHTRGVTAGSMRGYGVLETNTALESIGRRNVRGVAARPDRFPATQRAQDRRPNPVGKSRTTSRSARRRFWTSWRSIRSGSSVPMKRPGPKRGHSWGQASLAPPRITAPEGTRRSRRWRSTRTAGLPSIATAPRWATALGRRWPIGSLPIWVAWPTKSRSCRWTGSARSRS